MLTRDLGYRSVAEMEACLTTREYSDWAALYEIEGEEREKAANK